MSAYASLAYVADMQEHGIPITNAYISDAHDGRALTEEFDGWAVPAAMRNGYGLLLQMSRVYKQIDAPVGRLGLASMAAQMIAVLKGAEFRNQSIDKNQVKQFIVQGNALL
jgi:hypothetical protein